MPSTKVSLWVVSVFTALVVILSAAAPNTLATTHLGKHDEPFVAQLPILRWFGESPPTLTVRVGSHRWAQIKVVLSTEVTAESYDLYLLVENGVAVPNAIFSVGKVRQKLLPVSLGLFSALDGKWNQFRVKWMHRDGDAFNNHEYVFDLHPSTSRSFKVTAVAYRQVFRQ